MIKPDLRCALCNYGLDQATEAGPGDAQPKAGDLSICLLCANLAFYVDSPEGLILRPPTEEERADLATDPKVKGVVALILESLENKANLLRSVTAAVREVVDASGLDYLGFVLVTPETASASATVPIEAFTNHLRQLVERM